MYGEEEASRKEVVIKNMKTGSQQTEDAQNIEKTSFEF
mgnify:CR=1 FL=1